MEKFLLDKNNRPYEVTLEEWMAQPMDDPSRNVAQTFLDNDKVHISTVFLTIAHGYDLGRPILFETMVFARELPEIDNRMMRYCTWAEAQIGHAKMINYVNKYLEGSNEKSCID